MKMQVDPGQQSPGSIILFSVSPPHACAYNFLVTDCSTAPPHAWFADLGLGLEWAQRQRHLVWPEGLFGKFPEAAQRNNGKLPT